MKVWWTSFLSFCLLAFAGCPETALYQVDAGGTCAAWGDPCMGATPYCHELTVTCVECTDDAHCPAASAAACVNQACTGCSDHAQCAHLADTPACDSASGTCVPCTTDTEAAHCGIRSCDPATHTCTTTNRQSLFACDLCVADSECPADHRCVPMHFQGTPRPGGYCLKIASTGCVRPYVTAATGVSLSGAPMEDYCSLDQNATTCDALVDLRSSTSCTQATVIEDCGDPTLDDARCETIGLVDNLCTYSCVAANNCPSLSTCNGGYCGS